MNIHEYQAKEILKSFGVAIPEGHVVDDPSKAIEAAKKIKSVTGTDVWAVKAQIHAGGRGKGGGVKIAKSLEDVKKIEERLTKVEEEVEKRLDQANNQAKVVLSEAKSSGNKIEKQAQEKAEAQVKRILKKADERMQAKEKKMMSKLEGQVVDLAGKMVEKVLGDLDAGTKKEITKRALQQVSQKIKIKN